MGVEVAIGIGLGALSAVGNYVSQSAQAASQKSQLEYQAAVAQNEANLERQKGIVEQENLDREERAMREDFAAQQGHNLNMLSAGNLDITSGSASDVLEGNIGKFANDLAWQKYQQDVSQWETDQRAKSLEGQSSYLHSTASQLGPSLLGSAMAGVSAGLSGYSMAGGTFGNKPDKPAA